MKESKFYIKECSQGLMILLLLILITSGLSAQSIVGDVNRDGAINIIDALVVAQYSVGLSISFFDADAADVDGNGTLNIVDALIIAQYYVDIISQFPRPPVTPTPVPPDVDYITVINEWAKAREIDLTGYAINVIGSPESELLLPEFVFFHVYTRVYPVAYGNPDEQLGPSCLLAINTSLDIIVLKNENYLLPKKPPALQVVTVRLCLKAVPA